MSAPSVLVIGAGGLGCPALFALAAPLAARSATVGITIVDDDDVDASNLHRQILHCTKNIGRAKAESARERLRAIAPSLVVEAVRARVTERDARDWVRGRAVVLDGTDRVETKFLINDACVAERAPLVHGGVVGLAGQVMSVVPGAACYRCLFESPPDTGAIATCAEAGVLGPVCGVIGAMMAEEALAILDGKPRLAGALAVYDAGASPGRERRLVRFRARATCSACGRFTVEPDEKEVRA